MRACLPPPWRRVRRVFFLLPNLFFFTIVYVGFRERVSSLSGGKRFFSFESLEIMPWVKVKQTVEVKSWPVLILRTEPGCRTFLDVRNVQGGRCTAERTYGSIKMKGENDKFFQLSRWLKVYLRGRIISRISRKVDGSTCERWQDTKVNN